jgi:hypothetical protein
MYQTILHYVTHHQADILSVFGGAAGLSVLLESLLLKLKRSHWQIDSKKLAFTLLHVFAIVSSVATYLIGNLPKMDTATIYGSLVIAAEFWHRFAVSPLFSKTIIPFLDYLSKQTEPDLLPLRTGPALVQVQPKGLDPSGSVSPDQFL